ncbi:ABC transporter substrate-binding protein [Psychroflexus sp. CAK8W]|uniref:Thiamine pyrimidine synthase n=1 Tax=Psychroflexus longus TaxID=2873596 RepID=A0ABS7XP47_9FLAO|nr:ABC transporter substrate-binding protein [Psychroflexus longus]MBZ9779791.1 ABC transporter substrate-binding protein [Psychroflexus longus]
MDKLTLALDWTPNTIHTGFFVALEKGFYSDLNLDVHLRSPQVDSYESTPAKLLANKDVDFAIAPSESVISYQTLPDKPNLMAIAAILQEDTSAIVTLKTSGIDHMKQLDGKKYASYDARFEDTIISQMIKNDGGEGKHIKITPEKLGIWDTLLKGEADATWVFMPWEGVEAQRKGVELNVFQLQEYDIPYGYSPVLLSHPEILEEKQKAMINFLAATAKGFQWAAEIPDEAAELLLPHVDNKDMEFLKESQRYISKYYLTDTNQWGEMKAERWNSFVHWLAENKLIDKDEKNQLDQQLLFTNEYLNE